MELSTQAGVIRFHLHIGERKPHFPNSKRQPLFITKCPFWNTFLFNFLDKSKIIIHYLVLYCKLVGCFVLLLRPWQLKLFYAKLHSRAALLLWCMSHAFQLSRTTDMLWEMTQWSPLTIWKQWAVIQSRNPLVLLVLLLPEAIWSNCVSPMYWPKDKYINSAGKVIRS